MELMKASRQWATRPSDERFTKTIARGALKAHEEEEGRPIETMWDAVTGVTAYAKSIKYQDERVAVERGAGKLLDLVAA